MDIYSILSSKPHNPHYLNRYTTFIKQCQQKNVDCKGYTEKHHICPKADDMFSEYTDFRQHPWNCAILTARQHFIAHLILWKAFPNSYSCVDAIWNMECRSERKNGINSRLYQNYRISAAKKSSERAKKTNARLLKEGKHSFQNGDVRKRSEKTRKEMSRQRMDDGTHHCYSEKFKENNLHNLIQWNRDRIEDGTHHNFSENHPMKVRSNDSSHHWIGDNNPSKRKCKEGTHLFQDSEFQRNIQLKRILEGNHHLVGSVSCVDRIGKTKRIDKTIYYNQSGSKDEWEYVHFRTKEAARRKSNI